MLFIIMLIAVVAFVLGLMLSHEKAQRRAAHRARTEHLLSYIAFLPVELALSRNRAARWQG